MSKFKLALRRGSPLILACIGTIGVIGTAVLAVRGSKKADLVLEKIESNATTVQKAIAVVPAYAPAIASGIGTITCIIGSSVLSRKQQSQILGSYAVLNNYYKRYRSKLIELKGEETDQEIRAAMVRDHAWFHPIDMSDVPDLKVTFYDERSGVTFQRYEREVIDAEYHINRIFVMQGGVSLNTYYEFLGLPKVPDGDEIGWSCMDEMYWIDFEHKLITNQDDGGDDIYEIVPLFEPHRFDEDDIY